VLQDRLKDQIDTVTKRLAAMDAERQQLLTQSRQAATQPPASGRARQPPQPERDDGGGS
jgi:hypothetical protein